MHPNLGEKKAKKSTTTTTPLKKKRRKKVREIRRVLSALSLLSFLFRELNARLRAIASLSLLRFLLLFCSLLMWNDAKESQLVHTPDPRVICKSEKIEENILVEKHET